MALATAGLPLELLERLALDLEDAADRATERRNPLVVDVEQMDPREELRAWRSRLSVATSTAGALVAEPWCGPDGARVRLAPDCAAGESDEICVPAWSASGSRAHFLAWPVAHAVVVDAASPQEAEQLAEALRVAAARPSSRIGLVVTAAPASQGRVDAVARVARAIGRLPAAPAAEGPEDELLGLHEAVTEGPVPPPFLQDRPTRIVVVPRLGALAERAAYTAEVDAVLVSRRAP